MKRHAEAEDEQPLEPHSDVLNEMPIKPIKTYQVVTRYSKPVEIACFSYNSNREILLNDRSKLPYFYPPTMPADMKVGFKNNYVVRDPNPERLDALLKTLNSVKLDSQPEFCTWRGIVTKLVCTPYSKDEWELSATRHNGTIYIEEKRDVSFGTHPREQLFVYYGYKFEVLATHSSIPTNQSDKQAEARQELVVDTNIQFCSVFKTKLGRFSFVLAGEVDCIYKDDYCELKTNRVLQTLRQKENFIRYKGLTRYKLMRTWAQSFLIGVQHIIFGYRSDNGILLDTKVYETRELPRLARGLHSWDPNVCLTFADSVLGFIAENVTVDDKNICYSIKYNPQKNSIEIYRPAVGDMLQLLVAK